MADVVEAMVQRQPNILEQRSRRYKTAMAIAMDVEDAEPRGRLIEALKSSQVSVPAGLARETHEGC